MILRPEPTGKDTIEIFKFIAYKVVSNLCTNSPEEPFDLPASLGFVWP
jgi:hypothetical protein